MKIAHVLEMRQLDKQASEQYGIAEELLMENAGEAAYFTILKNSGIQGKKFVIFCGGGNNGGDGFVVARKLHSNGGKVTVFLLGMSSKFKGAAKLNYDIAVKLNLDIQPVKEIPPVKTTVAHCDVIVDAIFGTGLTRKVSGNYKEIIELINASQKPVYSLDIPSGVHGDTGQIMGTAVQAHHTIAFGLPKIGNLLYPGFELGGRLHVTHISFPPSMTESDSLKIAANELAPLPPRNPDGHKGRFGKVLFIAGSANYLGAPYFAAQSFLKAGGGLAFLAAPETVTPFIAAEGHEIIFVPQKATPAGSLRKINLSSLLEFSQKADMVVMGPGLSLHEETQSLVQSFATEIDKPLLLDGDGLTAAAANLTCIKNRSAATILTPHIGEMARITQKTVAEISADKITILQNSTQNLNAVIVLKGAHSLIGLPDGQVFVNLSGNAGMATAGSGDVLTGTIAALYGLGLPLQQAVCCGVFVHGYAGDLAAQTLGEDGMVASDILAHLPAAMKNYRSNFESVVSNHYQKIFLI